ncbi:CAP domain-containing protein [Piscinibacter koreensis]|uniref:CAP domain-containing protein n=1 Tax=Piscinibacter koreensis TaxID=2742824 RepID=A0A7Y6TWX9_9BURK|nr:CAP domain-containing protein [Schlegelella koreensis]NUZ06543.1 CAP domain-containing protein [Schlegelella koreensis]
MAAFQGVAIALWVAGSGLAAAQARPDLGAAARLMVEQSNAFRRAEGLEPLRADATLAAAAQGFADYMAKTDRYAHDADGRTPAQRIGSRGYAFCAVAENIGFALNTAGFATAELATTFVEGWKNSPPHRRNLLSTDVAEIGVGVAQSARSKRFYGVQVFARPEAEQIRFTVTNQSGREVGYRLGEQTYRLAPRVTRTHTICTPEPLALAGSAPVTPAAGARFTVDGAGGALQLRRE